MKINATEIRVGMILEYKDDLWEVLKTNHVKPGKGGAFAQVEMKSLSKSTKLNERFRSSETVEKALLEETKFNFLYKDENDFYFMNPETFEIVGKLEDGDTIYLTVADNEGNMVSLIQSNYRGMGSGMVPEGLGFMLQDRGELFSLD